jgi:hypothetical protein
VVVDDDCRAVTADLGPLDADTHVKFWFRDADGSSEPVALSLSSERAWSSSETVEFSSLSVDLEGSTPVRLLVGSRSAVLVIDDRIVAAVEIDGDTTVTAAFSGGEIRLNDVRTGPMPSFSGC